MNKLWMVAQREYMFNLKRPAFLFAAFGTPLIVVIAMILGGALGAGSVVSLEDYGSIGYVDNSAAQVLQADVQPETYPDIFLRYDTLDTARTALDDGEISAYLELTPLYLANGQVNLYRYENPPDELEDAIEVFLITNLTADLDIQIPIGRVQNAADLTIEVTGSGREVTQDSFVILLIGPMVFGFLLIMSSVTTGGFLLSGLVGEKTNRIIEVLVTSVTPMQLLGGKILGLGLLGLTQIVILLGAALIGLQIANTLEFVNNVTIPADLIVVAVVYYLLAYGLVASILAGIGAVSSSEQEGRQLSTLITLPMLVPYFFLVVFITDPTGTVPTLLSILPVTSPMGMIMRYGVTAVPVGELLLSIGLMVVTVLFAAWASARVFRWGLLLYGKKFNLRAIMRVVLRRRAVQMETTATEIKEVATS